MARNTLIVDPAYEGLEKNIVHWLGDGVKVCPVDFKKFPDSWPNLFIHRVNDVIEHQDVTLILDFSKPENLLRNVAIAQSVIDHTANKLRLIIPFFPVGTMERAKKIGEVTTAKTMATILSTIGNGREGKTSIHLFDLHDVRIKDFFGGNVNVELHTGMHLVDTSTYDAIAFPDKGAADRFGQYFVGKYIIICDKTRVDGSDDRIIVIKEGDPKDKRVLLVDDMIQKGGTTINTSKVLKNGGAKSVSAFTTHGVCPDESHLQVISAVDRLVVSDSIPENVQRAKKAKRMTVESIAPLVTRIMSKG